MWESEENFRNVELWKYENVEIKKRENDVFF